MVKRLRNLDGVETVYRARIRTVSVKLFSPYARTNGIELLTIGSYADVAAIVRTIYTTLDDDQEHFIILVLNVAKELIGYKVIASGTQDSVQIDPKILFRNALLLGAAGIILVHNHPSGTSDPSSSDIELTNKLLAGGRHLDLEIVDHIIYSRRGMTSLRQVLPGLFAEQGQAE